MPRQFRRCNFCLISTVDQPNLVFFILNQKKKKMLNIITDSDVFICENHFDPCDVRRHANSIILVHGAMPILPEPVPNHLVVHTEELDLIEMFTDHLVYLIVILRILSFLQLILTNLLAWMMKKLTVTPQIR